MVGCRSPFHLLAAVHFPKPGFSITQAVFWVLSTRPTLARSFISNRTPRVLLLVRPNSARNTADWSRSAWYRAPYRAASPAGVFLRKRVIHGGDGQEPPFRLSRCLFCLSFLLSFFCARACLLLSRSSPFSLSLSVLEVSSEGIHLSVTSSVCVSRPFMIQSPGTWFSGRGCTVWSATFLDLFGIRCDPEQQELCAALS